MTSQVQQGGVPSVDSAFRILGFLAQQGESLGVTAIARAINIPKSSCFKILMTLAQHEAVRQNQRDSSWRLGPRLLEFASATRRTNSRQSGLREVFQPLSDESGFACVVAQELAEHRGVVIIDRILPRTSQAKVVTMPVGAIESLGSPVLGSLVLASYDDDDATTIALAQGICNSSEETAALLQRLQVIRRQRFVASSDKHQPGFSGVGCAITLAGGEQFLVALIGKNQQLTEKRMNLLGPKLVHLADQLLAR